MVYLMVMTYGSTLDTTSLKVASMSTRMYGRQHWEMNWSAEKETMILVVVVVGHLPRLLLTSMHVMKLLDLLVDFLDVLCR